MRRLTVLGFLLPFLLLPAPWGHGVGAQKPWLAGVYAGFCGFSPATGLPAAAYLATGLFGEPLAIPVLNPALSCGLLLPVAPPVGEGFRLQFAGELTLVDLPAAVVKRRFYVSTCYSPALGVQYLFHPVVRAGSFSVVLSPLRFRAADGVFAFCSFQLFLAEDAQPAGWGVTLFRAALFLL
jgi:hypothetical protein